LNRVRRLLAVTQRPQRNGPQAVAVPPDELAESIGVPGCVFFEQRRVTEVGKT